MTFFEIYSAIANHVVAGEGTVNTRVPVEQIKKEVHNVRLTLLDKQVGTNKFHLAEWANTIKSVPLQPNDLSLNTDVSGYGGWYACVPAIYTHPKTGKALVGYVGTTDRREGLRVVTLEQYRYTDYDDHLLGCHQKAIVENTTLCIPQEQDYPDDEALLRAVFRDLDGLLDWESDYHPEESEYPMPGELHQVAIELLTKQYTSMYFRMNALQANTGRDTQGLQTK